MVFSVKKQKIRKNLKIILKCFTKLHFTKRNIRRTFVLVPAERHIYINKIVFVLKLQRSDIFI